jgi:hypothetical protein
MLQGRELERARSAFLDDVARFALVELDSRTVELAATAAELTGARTLDAALHLGAAQRLGTSTPMLTFDMRLARAARELGLSVFGAWSRRRLPHAITVGPRDRRAADVYRALQLDIELIDWELPPSRHDGL